MFFSNPENYEWYSKRCLLYIRVSTDEQARKGYSLEAQLEELETFAKQFCMDIKGVYADEGITARKNTRKRKGLASLLTAVEHGETDYILFIKLDRWFRNVSDYYSVQSILDAHNVGWKAILEDYDTSTTNGRLNLNIRLSIAQDESDRTGDRIRFVNDNRVKHGGVISGSLPFGLYPEKGKVAIDQEKAEVVKAGFKYYQQSMSVRKTLDFIENAFNVPFGYNTLRKMLSNKLYIGEYRDNMQYCAPIIEKETFGSVQQVLNRQNYTRERKHEYIFKSLLKCPECGHTLIAWAQKDYKYDRYYKRYRCGHHYIEKRCSFAFTPWEDRLERYLLENIEHQLRLSMNKHKRATNKFKTQDPANVKRKLTKLKELYVAELIDLEEYRKDYEQLTSQLKEIQDAKNIVDSSVMDTMQAFLEMDLQKVYPLFSITEKRNVWASILDHIEPISLKETKIYFL